MLQLFRELELDECGTVTTWKRIQGSNGKYQAFGFCDFEEPEGTLRALRVLNDFQIGEKKLVVKVTRLLRPPNTLWLNQKSVKSSAVGLYNTGKTLVCPGLQLLFDFTCYSCVIAV
ncbi:hypothetical protein ANCDUO_03850 [Ancylostoma duodenale]|uniref:RRM domain-containing protein n=1 Tax=Ancylostoma duodenale TaxID=51022 RepID=A0A0C2DSS7_9BILA|nr:hypothetical protein ANCDUO_03850 [Ancylostoma duodenale]